VVLGVRDTTWSEVLRGAWNQPAKLQSIPQMPHQQSTSQQSFKAYHTNKVVVISW
jgi:hypothetical protein